MPWEHNVHPQYRELEREDEEETNQHKSQELETIGGGKTSLSQKSLISKVVVMWPSNSEAT